jgi:photosystem II stability/assembly factor-like uncharacterized protein
MREVLNRWTRGLLGTLGVLVLSAVVACGSVGTGQPRVSPGTSYSGAAHASDPSPSGASAASAASTLQPAAASGFQPAAASFVSPGHGWVLGSGGGCDSCAQLRVTSDGGDRWAVLPAPSAPLGYYSRQPAAVTDMVFANSFDGFLFGPGLLATHDGGRSWVRQLLPPVLTIQTGDGYAYALTQQGQTGPVALWRSAVGGSRWQRLPLPTGAAGLSGVYPGMKLSAEGDTLVLLQVGLANALVNPGPAGRLWVSEDGGMQWGARSVPCRSGAGGAAVVSIAQGHTDAWLVDCYDNMQSSQEMDTQHHLYGTVNAGRTWVRRPDPTKHNAPVLLADNGSGHAFLATEGGLGDTLVGTTDGGLSWGMLLQSGGSFSGWADLGFVTASVGFVVGPTHYAPGHLYRTQDGGRTWQVVPVS